MEREGLVSVEKVAPLAPIPNEHIIKACREILADAESGQLIAFAIAAVDAQGCTMTRFTNAATTRLIGATSHLLYRLNKYWDEVE